MLSRSGQNKSQAEVLTIFQIMLNCIFGFVKVVNGFVEVVTHMSRPLSNKTKLNFDKDFEAS